MSMTAEERKAWAHENLDRYLRDVEIGEFLDELQDMNAETEGRLDSLEVGQEEMQRDIDRLAHDLTTLEEQTDERFDELAQDTA